MVPPVIVPAAVMFCVTLTLPVTLAAPMTSSL
jgi:hypothetical protein